MKNIMLLVLIIIPLFIEGTGIIPYSQHITLLFPVIYLILTFVNFKSNKIIVTLRSSKEIYFYTFFMVATFLAFLVSPDMNKSLTFLLLYLLSGCVYIAILLRKEEIHKQLLDALLVLGVLFILIHGVITAIASTVPSILPNNGYQLVFPWVSTHNHLGDFLALCMVVCSWKVLIENKQKYLFLLILMFLFYATSYSRSAYSSYSITMVTIFLLTYKQIKERKQYLSGLIIGLLIIASVFLFFSTVIESKKIPVFSFINQQLEHYAGLKGKLFEARRIEYLNTAHNAFLEEPFLGFGPGNFVNASQKFSTIPNYRTHTAHNIFLDILVENGIIALYFFTVFVLYVFSKAKRTSVYTYLALLLLINFLSDYTYRIFSLFLLWNLFLIFMQRDNRKLS